MPSVRLTLAGASSARATGTLCLAAGLFHPVRFRLRGRLLRQAGFELFLDLDEFFRLSLEVARVGPLKPSLELAANLPVNVAEVIVDGGIFGLELNRVLEMLHRLLVIADPVIGPAKRVHNVAIIRTLLRRTLNHAHAVIEIDALVDP